MLVSDLIVLPVEVIYTHEDINQAASKFGRIDIKELPVVNKKNQFLGVIYRKKLLEALGDSNNNTYSVKQLTEKPLRTINQFEKVNKISSCSSNLIYWVVNDNNELIGYLDFSASLFNIGSEGSINHNDMICGENLRLPEHACLLISVLESFFDGIWISDGQGNTLYVNSAYERITGLSKEQLIGKNMHELLKENLFSQSTVLQVLEKKVPVSIVHSYVTGKRALATGNPVFNKDGNIVRVVCEVRDISELIELKNELTINKELSNKYSHELKYLRQQHIRDLGFIAKSKSMEDLVSRVNKVAEYDTTVLLLGETGVGKEVLSRYIHQQSLRSNKPFLKVNCAAIPETLIESELFGYVKGAFTGASQMGKPGLFELADQGTLLLDEVTDLPLWIQSKLLRAIEEKEIFRIGDNASKKLNVRIIATTNKNPTSLVEKGELRKDLFFRLNVIPIEIPPLRDRREDIPELAFFFLKKQNERYKKQKTFSTEVINVFLKYSWPGNVRELENLVENLFIVSPTNEISVDLLPAFLFSECVVENIYDYGKLRSIIAQFEREVIIVVLKKHQSMRSAAKELGVNASTLSRKIKTYQIKRDA